MRAIIKLQDWLWAEATGASEDDALYFRAGHDLIAAMLREGDPILMRKIDAEVADILSEAEDADEY